METITLRELRLGKDEIQRKLREQKQLVLTVNGRPIAVIAEIEPDRVEETLAALKQARAQVALARVRQAAQTQGLDNLTEAEIEAEIEAVRQERYAKHAGAPEQ